MNQTLDRAQHSSDDAPCRLVVEEGEQKGMVFPLRDKVVSVGRGPDNVIQIIDPRMSRNHTLFILNGSQWLVRDLGSKNGTLLNGRAIPGDQVLGHGDRIQIGDTVFAFELEPTHDGHVETSSGVRVLDDHGMLVPSQILRMSEKSSGDSTAPLYTMPYAGNRQLGVLYRLLDVTSIVLNLDELLEKIIDLVQETLKPDRSGILLHDERYGILLPRAVRRPPDSTDDIIISNSIITKSVEDEVAIIVSDAPRDARFRASDSIVIQRIHSALCAPLIFNNEVLGVIYLDRRRPSGSFGEEDLKLVAGIAKQSAVAIANACFHSQLLEQHARARELEIARTIQEHLLPKSMPELDNFEISGTTRPAYMVGGDYFDVISLPDGRLVLAIADVTGKGVPAAILLAAIRTAVQIEVRSLGNETLATIVDRINQMVCRDTSNSMFVTMVLGVLDPHTRQFTYCNAGHVHPLLCLADGTLRTLESGGTLLGVMPGINYETETLELPPGGMLLMYSDGVTDAQNVKGDMFGQQRIINYLRRHVGEPAADFRRGMLEEVNRFSRDAEAFDDVTILVAKSLDRRDTF